MGGSKTAAPTLKEEGNVHTPFRVGAKQNTNPHWQMIMHCMNHSTYHRGQIITMLRELRIATIPAIEYDSLL